MENTLKKHIPLKIFLALLPALLFCQNYSMMTVNRSIGLGFLVIWGLMIWSVSQMSEKNHIIERLLRLTEISLFLLPISAIIFSFVFGSQAVGSTGNQFEQAGAAIGTAIGGTFVVTISFIIGLIGGLIMHLIASKYEKKAESSGVKQADNLSNKHGTILALIGVILLAMVLGSISKGVEVASDHRNIKTGQAQEKKASVDVEVVDKGFVTANFQSQITMHLKFINKTDKAIKGVQGNLSFYDIFDNQIKILGIAYDEGIPPNDSKIWEAGIDYNQFIDYDVKLNNTDLKNLKYEWVVQTVIYEDGTKETH